MTVLKIVALLAVLAALGWSAIALNRHCRARYQYEPFSFTNTTLMAISVVLLVGSAFTIPEGGSVANILDGLLKFKLAEKDSNYVALVAISFLIAIGVFIYTAIKTSPLIAAYATTIQLCAAVIILLLIIVIAILTSEPKQKHRRRRG